MLAEAAVAEKLKAAGRQVVGGGSETLTKLVEQRKARVREIAKSIELKAAKIVTRRVMAVSARPADSVADPRAGHRITTILCIAVERGVIEALATERR